MAAPNGYINPPFFRYETVTYVCFGSCGMMKMLLGTDTSSFNTK